MASSNSDELARRLAAMSGEDPPADDRAEETEDADADSQPPTQAAQPPTRRPAAPVPIGAAPTPARPPTPTLRPAAPTSPIAPYASPTPPPSPVARVPYFMKTGFLQTLIPVALTIGALCLGVGSMGYLFADDSPYAVFRGGITASLAALGAIFLLLAGTSMMLIKNRLR